MATFAEAPNGASATPYAHRVPFASLTAQGKLNALRLWQPDYFTGSAEPEYRDLPLAQWQALVMAHHETDAAARYMGDQSGRM